MKFRYSFQVCLTPIYFYRYEIEANIYYLFQGAGYLKEKMTLINKIRNINIGILEQNDTIITQDPPLENISLNDTSNNFI